MMKCPQCTAAIHFDKEQAYCTEGHTFPVKNGAYQVMTPEFTAQLSTFLEGFEDFRADEVAKYSPEVLRNLPEASFDTGLWNLRKMDLDLVREVLQPEYKTALDVGAWNGWLSHHLARMGLETTAVDLFLHELDGLGAKVHYEEDWRTIQMNLQRLDLLGTTFDLIVVNRSIPYFTDMFAALEILKSLVAPGGTLLITGMTYTKDAARIDRELAEAKSAFEERYGTPFRLHEFRGYLLASDLKRFQKSGVDIRLYPKLRLQSMVGKLIASRPVYYYGMFVQH